MTEHRTPKKWVRSLGAGLTACAAAATMVVGVAAANPEAAQEFFAHITSAVKVDEFRRDLTTKDGAWEATFDTDYQIYKDLTLAVELGYIHLSLNDGVWGNVLDNTERNAYKASVNMRYAF